MKRKITNRECEVLQCLAEGLTTTEAARKLFLSTDTIKTYRSRLLMKLEAKNAFQLGMKANKFLFINEEREPQLMAV